MKRFNFNLQKVLQLRKYNEEDRKIQLGQAIGILSEIENNINIVASNRRLAANERFSGTADILSWELYINRLDQQTESLLKDAAKAELVVEEKRNAYLEAARELKAMEKLKEKREKEHRKEMFAAETAELDLQANNKRYFSQNQKELQLQQQY